ncbi:MAG TPA: hypothetical protein VGI39_18995 [Polyangiaceae bacterium]
MTTKPAKKTTHASSTHNQEETVMSTESTLQNSFQPIQPIPTPAPAPTPTPVPIIFVAPPPPDVSIPTIDYAAATPGEFRNVMPRASELTALAQAIKDLSAFKGYTLTFGSAAPDYEEVVQAFTVGAQWTSMRTLSSSWDGYCLVQQGLAWRAIRMLMSQLVPIFAIAAAANPKLLTQYPGLASLLGAKKTIAQKGASTRKANKTAKAEGKPETHGVVGKQNQRRLEKAAAAQLAAAATATGTTATAAPVATSQPVVVTPAAPSPAPAAVAPATNGAAHS